MNSLYTSSWAKNVAPNKDALWNHEFKEIVNEGTRGRAAHPAYAKLMGMQSVKNLKGTMTPRYFATKVLKQLEKEHPEEKIEDIIANITDEDITSMMNVAAQMSRKLQMKPEMTFSATKAEKTAPINQRFQKGEPIDIALITFNEYVKLVNPTDKYHDNHWDYNLETLNRTTKNLSDLKLFQRKKIGNLEILFYESREKINYGRWENNVYKSLTESEIKEANLPLYDIGIYAFHDNKEIGFVIDEWGATLVVVAKEYKGNGIGKLLTFYFRKKHPDRSSGGLTQGGYSNLKNVYREFVKEYLRNGIYSHLVKTGKITPSKVKEIIKSADLENYKPERITDLAKNYNINEITENLLFWRYNDDDFVIFDKKILESWKNNDETLKEHFIKAHVYFAYNTVYNSYELYESYGISEKFETILLNIALETLKYEEDCGVIIRVVNSLSKQTLDILNKFKKSDLYTLSKIKDVDYIEAKESENYEAFFKKSQLFFKKNDKFEELENYIIELAYKMGQ